MKSICIITSYFPPETGAASNRIFHLANGLHSLGYSVSVITPLPNYPKGKIFKEYKGKFKHQKKENDIVINRLWIYASNSKNKVLRLLAMLSYSFSLIWFFIWNKLPEKIIVQSPPLLVAFTCMFFLNGRKHKLILNISDLWPIAGLELGAFRNNFSYRMLERIEKFNYKKADLILGQSNEILTHVSKIFPDKETFLYRNFPDFTPKTLTPDTSYSSESKIKVVYAGLLGIAQGIFKLCKELDYSNIEFHIYGAGAEQEKIETYISENPKSPIIYHGELTREQLHKELLRYDLTIIPLLSRIYGSVPSKIFEYARLGIPMLYFGGGEGESIIEKHNIGWVSKAGDYITLNKVLSKIRLDDLTFEKKLSIQKTAVKSFDFKTQLKNLSQRI